MTVLKSIARLGIAALFLLGMNGLINVVLMTPLQGKSEAFNHYRIHLDDAIFVLLFIFISLVFWAMFAVLPRERGYLYLGTISLLTSLQLFLDWDGKSLLFGPLPEIPFGTLAIKSGMTFLFFSFASYLLGTVKNPFTNVFLWAGGLLWTTILSALALSANDSFLTFLNLLFLVHVFLNMALCISQFLSLLRSKQQHQSELRLIGSGFILFLIVLLPDPLKDLLEMILGHSIGYQLKFWEECLEDTFSWALLSLLTVFGFVFFHRFVQTMRDNHEVSEKLRSKNETLEQEVETRQRLDQLFTVLLGKYRIADLEKGVIREGHRYFQPYNFALVKFNEVTESVETVGDEGSLSPMRGIGEAMRSRRNRLNVGEAIITPDFVLGAAGNQAEVGLYLAVYTTNGGSILLEERDMFALLLMSKYVSIFYEYFQLIEDRFKEIEQRQAERAPWLSKLFMQIAEKERKRLASDLHDDVLQELLHIRRTLDRKPEEQESHDLKEQLRIGLDNAAFLIRETCRELMPSFLSDHGVLYAVSKLVEKTQLRVDFQLDYLALPLNASLDDEQMTVVYRVVQELINNASKHSEASRVTLEIGQQDKDLHIWYTDNGKGMEFNNVLTSTDGLGLRGMMERVRMLGGEVTVDTSPGQGVVVNCTLPI